MVGGGKDGCAIKVAVTILLTTTILCIVFVFFSTRWAGWRVTVSVSSHEKEMTELIDAQHNQRKEIAKMRKEAIRLEGKYREAVRKMEERRMRNAN